MNKLEKKESIWKNSSQLDKKLMVSYFLKNSKYFSEPSSETVKSSFFFRFLKGREKKSLVRSRIREKLWSSLLH